MQKMSIRELNHFIRESLQEIYPEREINSLIHLIYEKKVNLKKTDLLLNEDQLLDQKSTKNIVEIIHQLKKNIPIQYILGETTFYDLELNINPSVLIPRQETEELVDWIIENHSNTTPTILDIGTGSGCIAVALAKNLPGSEVDALDVDKQTLKTATRNARKNKTHINPVHCDILKENPVLQHYHIIVSNPPYVLNSEKKFINNNVLEHEPEKALFVDDSKALVFYERIAGLAWEHLYTGGNLYFEINEQKGEEVKTLLKNTGYTNIELKKDINGKDRMIKATKP